MDKPKGKPGLTANKSKGPHSVDAGKGGPSIKASRMSPLRGGKK